MSQQAISVSDDFDGNWEPPTPLERPLFQWIDTAPPNDDTPIASMVNPHGDAFQVKLQGLAWPAPGAQVLTVGLAGDGATHATVVLWQGDEVIAAQTFLPTTTWSYQTLILTDDQKALISNYADLHVEISAGDVLVPCCGTSLPAVLHVTLVNTAGPTGCPCFGSGVTFILIYDPTQQIWTGGGAWGACGMNATFNLRCQLVGGDYTWQGQLTLSNGCFADTYHGVDSFVCNPFQATFHYSSPFYDGCGCPPGPNGACVATVTV